MANETELIMPKMGESIAEATILKWLKKEGDTIELDEAVLEIATDKVDSEVPSPTAGVLGKILFQEGDVVAVGKAIATILQQGASASTAAPAPAETKKEAKPEKVAEAMVNKGMELATPVAVNGDNGNAKSGFYSPLVLNIARSEQISMTELEAIPGTGKDNRVTKRDILAYLENRKSAPAAAAPAPKAEAPAPAASTASAAPVPAAHKAPDVVSMAGDEIIEMDRMRRLIADHMVMSKHVSPHVTSFVEADVTSMVLWRNKIKSAFEKREGEKITFTPIFIEAVARAIKDFPMINITVTPDMKIVKRKNINIGMAAALPTGNLIVPVIKNADTKNLIGLAKDVNDLANRARKNALKPDDIQGGTFTLTNVGGFGNVMGTPIINQPQVAILATGSIQKKPVVVETEMGDVIAIRHMMFLSLSYDHRVVDGSLGGTFLRRVADYLEGFDINREI